MVDGEYCDNMIWRKVKKPSKEDDKKEEDKTFCSFPTDRKYSCQSCENKSYANFCSINPPYHCVVMKEDISDESGEIWRTWDRCDAYKNEKECDTCAHYKMFIVGDIETKRSKYMCPSYEFDIGSPRQKCKNWEAKEGIDIPQ